MDKRVSSVGLEDDREANQMCAVQRVRKCELDAADPPTSETKLDKFRGQLAKWTHVWPYRNAKSSYSHPAAGILRNGLQADYDQAVLSTTAHKKRSKEGLIAQQGWRREVGTERRRPGMTGNANEY